MKKLLSLVAALFLASQAHASFNLFDSRLQASDANFTMDLKGSNAYKGVAAQLNASTPALVAKTFDAGTIGHGTCTVESNTGVAGAPATFSLVVVSTQPLKGKTITINGVGYITGTRCTLCKCGGSQPNCYTKNNRQI